MNQHTMGAGGIITNITGTNGIAFMIPVLAEDGSLVANIVRRLIVVGDNEEPVIDMQVSFGDAAFIAKSIINYLLSDLEMLEKTENMTLFFSDKPGIRPQDKMAADLRESARNLALIADKLDKMPVALVASEPET